MCTKISPINRSSVLNDAVLFVDKAFYVEKDFNTFGYVGTTSDPDKGSGGGAIMMGQGFTGKYCPPMFILTGILPSGQFGGYNKGSSFPAATNEAWFYRTDQNKLYQYTKNSSGVFAWRERFSFVHSSDYDTLFLYKSTWAVGTPFEGANLHLGGLTATDAIYVDQIKHLDGTNWTFNSGSSGGVQTGSVTTNSSGIGTFTFPTGTFPSGYTPKIVCTAHDASGRSITTVITSKNNTGFTVKAFIVDSHKHKVGQVYNTTNQPLVIAKGGKHHHYAVGNTGTTSHRHGISSQSDHTHGITNGNVGSYNTSYVTAGGTNHAHTYSSWAAATNTNNGGNHNHGGNTDYETTHAHSYATTTSGSGNTAQDADAEHTHTFSQIPAYMRETIMYDQSGGQVHTGATFTTIADNTQVTEIYTVTTVNTPISIAVDWMAI